MKNKNQLTKKLDSLIKRTGKKFPYEDILSIDLQVYDINIGVSTGPIASLPDSFLSPKKLLSVLKKRGLTAFTVTGRENTASCMELKSYGHDILTGCEFICYAPKTEKPLKVLAFGFTASQLKELAALKNDVFEFAEYAKEANIPLVWADPDPADNMFTKLYLIFQNIMVVNGQWPAAKTIALAEALLSLSETKLKSMAAEYGIAPEKYCANPYKKGFAGASGSLSGLFAGKTGSRLYVPNLEERLKTSPASLLSLEALLAGNVAPFGETGSQGKALLDILFVASEQALGICDEYLPEIFLQDSGRAKKIFSFAMAYSLLKAKKKPFAVTGLKFFNKCVKGGLPQTVFKVLPVSSAYKKIWQRLADINARMKKEEPAESVSQSVKLIYGELLRLLAENLTANLRKISGTEAWNIVSASDLNKNGKDADNESPFALSADDFDRLLNKLALPAAGVSLFTAAYFYAARRNQPQVRSNSAPKRMLWLTDTLEDGNGIAMFLQSMLREIKRRDLPVDLLVCSDKLHPENHLKIVPTVAGFTLPFYPQQPFRIPNFVEIQEVFAKGGYTCIMASTEGPMGIASLYLKHAFGIPAYFYMHTDWKAFGREMLKFSRQKLTRWEAYLIDIYGAFDRLFVLNSDQRKWLTGERMGFPTKRVIQTAHWADEEFKPKKPDKEKLLGIKAESSVLLFVGRLSEEKGIFDLPYIYGEIKKSLPDTTRVIAGTGPEEKKLKSLLPDAVFLGWVPHTKLPEIFSSADMLILPSKFDTFGVVVLEALACGCPVAAYNMKGPKDILTHGKNGFLASARSNLAADIKDYLLHKERHKAVKKQALKRAAEYSAEKITNLLLQSIGFTK